MFDVRFARCREVGRGYRRRFGRLIGMMTTDVSTDMPDVCVCEQRRESMEEIEEAARGKPVMHINVSTKSSRE